VELEQAVKGCEVEVEMDKRVVCGECKGTKAEKASKPRKCFECGGRGSVEGNYGVRKKCPKCNGAGYSVKQPCPKCEGVGVVRETVTEKIQLPEGLVQQQKLKIRGLGHASEVFQGRAGDLLLEVNIKAHPDFQMERNNVYSTLHLTMLEAMLGQEVVVKTLYGDKKI